jgi:hypothetical protein
MIVSDAYLKDLLRQVVCLKAHGHCEYPGCPVAGEDLNPHHFFSVDNNSLRYNDEACLWLCTPHHTGITESAHLSPEAFNDLILSRGVRSYGWFLNLIATKNQIIRNDNDFRVICKGRLLEKLQELRLIIPRLENVDPLFVVNK